MYSSSILRSACVREVSRGNIYRSDFYQGIYKKSCVQNDHNNLIYQNSEKPHVVYQSNQEYNIDDINFRDYIRGNIVYDLYDISDTNIFMFFLASYFLTKNNFTWKFLSFIEAKRNQSYSHAAELLDILLINKPNDIYFLTEKENTNVTYMKCGYLKKICKIQEKIKDLFNTTPYLRSNHNIYSKAFSFMISEDYEKALSIFQTKISENDDEENAFCFYYQNLCLLALGKTQEIVYFNYIKILNRNIYLNNNDETFQVLKEFIGALAFNKLYDQALKWVDLGIKKLNFKNRIHYDEILFIKFFLLVLKRESKKASELIESMFSGIPFEVNYYRIYFGLDQYLLDRIDEIYILKKKDFNQFDVENAEQQLRKFVNYIDPQNGTNNRRDSFCQLEGDSGSGYSPLMAIKEDILEVAEPRNGNKYL